MTLNIDDFEGFHRAVHGYPPFAWQSRLLRQVMRERRWPRVLELPTGTGKTTCLDIAVFALALDAANPAKERWHPRRIAMIVDRRIVVDQAAARGHRLRRALEAAADLSAITPETAVVRAVAEALRTLGGRSQSPLGVHTLRGGIPKDDGWARSPDQPLVITSTVDQLGSRMLMQGYGVTTGMRPVHAGLAGNDTLILLDEAHLSQPFRQTVERLQRLRERFASNGLPQRVQLAFLSATPGAAERDVFSLSVEDIEADPLIATRLQARKPAAIEDVSGREALAERVAAVARTLMARHRVVAAVVNRVDTALAVYAELHATFGDDCVLLTGRMRPLDRDDVLARVLSRIQAGARQRTAEERPFVVVGTQCIEAGADFDFDAIVTESASIDALRQRFGRVDRLGLYLDAAGVGLAEGVIVHDKASKDDPIYGDALAATVKFLKNTATGPRKAPTVDFGSTALRDAPPELTAPRADAPTLLPAYLDLWAQSSPAPSSVPEPGLFLHGPRSGPADVQVVWRADLEGALWDAADLESIVAVVGAIPPTALEAISLPFAAARRWLSGHRAESLRDVSDLETKEIPDERDRPEGGAQVLRWSGEGSALVVGSQIRPGDTLVVPASLGGIDPASRCFDPTATAAVQDLAERASLFARGRAVLRLHPAVLSGLGLDVDCEEPREARRALGVLSAELSGWQRPWAQALAGGRRAVTVALHSGVEDGWFLLDGGRVRVPQEMTSDATESGASFTTEAEDSSFTGVPVSLADHSRHVESLARSFAERLGLPDGLVNDVALAAWLHDIGKSDPRFQRLLHGGSEIAYYRDGATPLAKSGIPSRSVEERRRARELSGLPHGARHELQSVAMLQAAQESLAGLANDWELVLYLVASHHGHCRPFAPVSVDPAPVSVALTGHHSERFGVTDLPATGSAHGLHRLDSDVAARFWSLVSRYGWLELCWLETILRLADHRSSELEEGEQE